MQLFAHRGSTLALGIAVLLVLGAVLPACGPFMSEAMAMPMVPSAPESPDCDTGVPGSECVMSEDSVTAAPATRDVEPLALAIQAPSAPLCAVDTVVDPVVPNGTAAPPAHLTPLRI